MDADVTLIPNRHPRPNSWIVMGAQGIPLGKITRLKTREYVAHALRTIIQNPLLQEEFPLLDDHGDEALFATRLVAIPLIIKMARPILTGSLT